MVWQRVEGTSPTPEQLAVLSNIWRALADHFGFALVSFDKACFLTVISSWESLISGFVRIFPEQWLGLSSREGPGSVA
jgi:hypothetical protein